MVRVERIRQMDGNGRAVIDMQDSTVAELPAKFSKVATRLFVMPGSIAQVIQTGAFYTLDENGTWYDENGDAAS